MLHPDQIAITEQRFNDRRLDRELSESRLRAGDVLSASSEELVRGRLKRLGLEGRETARIIVDTHVPPVVVDDVRSLALERLVGGNDLVSSHFLSAGARISRSVCWVVVTGDASPTMDGTGVMVSPRLMLTNNHVLATVNQALNSTATFNYELDAFGQVTRPVRFRCDPDAFFATDQGLDFTLVALEPRGVDGSRPQDFGWAPLIADPAKVIVGERLNIIQHPDGGLKRVALRENQVVDILDNFLHYETDTAPGSSGAPVFNDDWELVALHHSGVPERDRDGRVLAVDGDVWAPAMGERNIKWVANEGVRISSIVRALKGGA